MLKKTVRDMSYLERLRYSLGSKIFHIILAFSITLSIAAIGFGFYLYVNSINERYSSAAYNMAKTGALVYESQNVNHFVNEVLHVYEGLDEDTISQVGTDAYKKQFDSIINAEYIRTVQILSKLADENDMKYIYMAAFDKETNRLIYILDTDDTSHPGYFDDTDGIYLDLARMEESTDFFGTVKVPHLVEKSEEYGYLCISWKVLSESDRYIIMSMADVDMNVVAHKSRVFFFQYITILALLAIILDVIIVQRVKKHIVKPITEINEAARNYIQDRGNGITHSNHFRSLNIHTGDEIESLALMIGDMELDIEQFEDNLTAVTAEKERIGAELNVASRIQEGMLPSIFPAFPELKEFDIHASMHTAKEVGGDFYDFYLIDSNHLAMVIADVSGKGIPAALFMMASKIMINSISNTGIVDPGKILEAVNERICSNNTAEMFVTVWLGILEISSGKVIASNGGHEYPYLLRDGKYELLKDKHGLVLGGLPNSKYTSYEFQLQPGDGIYVYTDGVTEATNANRELFGNDRLTEVLNQHVGSKPEQLLIQVKEAIDDFVQEAPQFDDITMLALQYNGVRDVHELTIEATIENIDAVTDFVNAKLEQYDCPMKAQMQIDVAIDELFSNIAKFAYNPETGPATVRVEVDEDPMEVIITFIDHGQPYDPLTNEDPDITLDADKRDIGGLGIYLVKKTMDDVSYEYKDGQNILKIKKAINDK